MASLYRDQECNRYPPKSHNWTEEEWERGAGRNDRLERTAAAEADGRTNGTMFRSIHTVCLKGL